MVSNFLFPEWVYIQVVHVHVEHLNRLKFLGDGILKPESWSPVVTLVVLDHVESKPLPLQSLGLPHCLERVCLSGL